MIENIGVVMAHVTLAADDASYGFHPTIFVLRARHQRPAHAQFASITDTEENAISLQHLTITGIGETGQHSGQSEVLGI